ncbi:TetR/AcrR family transcriptional regulator [Cellulomonas sp. APG4]|uniref:TetR/AcrR family transcriptional regulator n=1 Tax=Cellulomonas sp. APG4 TaxID=1538656 RepID=UPI00137B7B9E|nr:TetR/AcrR family transcriptional regulator [Cellulomonas sp. APG4]NCT90734.1 TetR/AcrR family transcriptional regulator [Cellulomonas sp. APG4]
MVRGAPTQQRILDAAERLFFGDGIAVTGMDALAAEAGVSVVTIYHHFGSKDGVLQAVLTRRLTAWTTAWDTAIARAATPEDRLLAVFDAIETFRSANGRTQWCCFLSTVSERPSPTGADPDPVHALVRQDTAELVGRLGSLAEAADLTDPRATAATLLVIYNGVLSSLLRGEPEDPFQAARVAARLVVSAARRPG